MNPIGWTQAASPFHPGEQAVQARLGLRDQVEGFGRKAIRDFMPDQHRSFYAQLPFLVVGHVDAGGWPWASILAGEPGFTSSPDARTLVVDAAPVAGDPLAGALTPGTPLGLIGLDFGSRRRNRLSAHVARTGPDGLRLAVDQTFGNCPQYIQTRMVGRGRDPRTPSGQVERLTSLDPAAEALIAQADTFFVASAAPSKAGSPEHGVDASHRGGRPGFIRVDDARTLTVPDYTGNFLFNTLGNFLINPKAGLLFVDFATGDLLMLTGTVEIIWDGPLVDAFKGAERLWQFRLDHGLRLRDAVPLRWTFGDYSPNTLITGTWDEAEATLAAEAKREAWRPYRIVETVDESAVVRSFVLEPADGDGVPGFEAGQYLTLRVSPEGADRPLIRTYTVSSAPLDPRLRISVKREPRGAVSNHLHDRLRPGDVIEAKAPRGDFTLDAAETRPAVLLAGGVGVTPMIAMLRHVVHEGLRTRHMRPVTLIHAARTTAERAFFNEARQLAAVSGGAIRYRSLISRPGPGDRPVRDFDGSGRITASVLGQLLAPDGEDVYLCGPPSFIQAMYDILRDLGIRDGRIRAEAFGPASLVRRQDAETATPPSVCESDGAVISFAKSGFEMSWRPDDGTLLSFAEAHGVSPDYGCRNGACGTCAVRLVSGAVAYRTQPRAAHGADEALICCAVPADGTDRIELDL